jgi:hypothetical protein
VAEQFADGLVTTQERERARNAAVRAAHVAVYNSSSLWVAHTAAYISVAAALAVSLEGEDVFTLRLHRTRPWLSNLVRSGWAAGASGCCLDAGTWDAASERKARALARLPWWRRWWFRAKFAWQELDVQPILTESQRGWLETLEEFRLAEGRAQVHLVHDLFGHPDCPLVCQRCRSCRQYCSLAGSRRRFAMVGSPGHGDPTTLCKTDFAGRSPPFGAASLFRRNGGSRQPWRRPIDANPAGMPGRSAAPHSARRKGSTALSRDSYRARSAAPQSSNA